MIILDTNVIAEPLKPQPEPAVIGWLDSQARQDLYLTAISYAELLVGAEWLPEGRRKLRLKESINQMVGRYFGERILAFDQYAAIASATILNRARQSGYNIARPDGQIAAVAAAHSFTVATRDVRPFEAAGIRVINPWLAEA